MYISNFLGTCASHVDSVLLLRFSLQDHARFARSFACRYQSVQLCPDVRSASDVSLDAFLIDLNIGVLEFCVARRWSEQTPLYSRIVGDCKLLHAVHMDATDGPRLEAR